MVKVGLWALLILCVIAFAWNCYDLVWKDRDSGWRAFDLLSLLMEISIAARVIGWLF